MDFYKNPKSPSSTITEKSQLSELNNVKRLVEYAIQSVKKTIQELNAASQNFYRGRFLDEIEQLERIRSRLQEKLESLSFK